MTEVQKLHTRAARGEILSIEEQATLEAWYKEQDEAEAKQLLSASSSQSLTVLQEQTATVVKQLEATAQYIQETLLTNEALRQKNVALTVKMLRL